MGKPLGELVSIGTHRLHIVRTGVGEPAVVFDAALAGSVLSWVRVQPAVSEVTTTISYDRAGHGWSEAGPMPRTVAVAAFELKALLAAAPVRTPIVLVGHSYGALVARLFAARNPADVCGLVLVDPPRSANWLHPDDREIARIRLGTRLCRSGATAARLGVAQIVALLVRLGALSAARACAKLVSGGTLRREHEQILAPIANLPATARRHLYGRWSRRDFFEAVGSEIESIHATAAAFAPYDDASYRSLPVTVISAADADPDSQRDHQRVARLSSAGRHLVARHGGHWLPLEEPELVIEAVAAAVKTVRR